MLSNTYENSTSSEINFQKISNKTLVKLPSKEKEDVINQRKQVLLDLGFSKRNIEEIKKNSSLLVANPYKKIQELQSLGFTEPLSTIQKYIGIFFMTKNNIRQTIAFIKSTGVNPITVIQKFPKILGYNIKSMKEQIRFIQKKGVTNTRKVIDQCSSFFGYGEDNLEKKIQNLQSLGIKDIPAVIEKYPSILTYSTDNINHKVAILTELGFTDIPELLQLQPSILGYNFEKNISQKMKLLKKILQDDESVIQLLENAPEILGTNIKKSLLIIRGLQELEILKPEILKDYKRINIVPIHFFVAIISQLKNDPDFLKLETNERIRYLRREIKKVRKIYTKEEIIQEIQKQAETTLTKKYKKDFLKQTKK